MPGSSKQSAKRKPSEVAAETKRTYLPHIKKQYAQTHSYLFDHPPTQCVFGPENRPASLTHPEFCKQTTRRSGNDTASSLLEDTNMTCIRVTAYGMYAPIHRAFCTFMPT